MSIKPHAGDAPGNALPVTTRNARRSRSARPDHPDLEILAGFLETRLGAKRARLVGGRLLARAGSLAGVAATTGPILRAQGLSDAAVSDIARARSLASAMARDLACRGPVLSSWSALVDYLRVALAHLPREEFRVLYLDKRNVLMREEHRAPGTTDHAPVYVKEVLRTSLEMSASAMILVHNHPSGDPTPSRADIEMTRRILEAARIFDIDVHDHVVVGREGTKSFRALGLM